MNSTSDLNYFLNPKSVAIIGASGTPGKAGYNFINNLLGWGYSGSIYPVNPQSDQILGLKAYPRITDIPEEVDLAVPIVQPSLVPDVIRHCAEKSVKAVMVASPGFSEAGSEGQRLEAEVMDIAGANGIRIMGPNTQGIINLDTGLVAVTVIPVGELNNGKGVGIICHSGWFYSDWILRCLLIGMNRMIDLGSMADVDDVEALECLGVDPQTRVILMHIEGIRDGRRFLKVADEVVRKKPVVALKVGRSKVGAQSVASHTGSLAGNDAVHDIAFRQAGIARAIDMDEAIDFTKTFACLEPLPVGNRIGMITFSGTGGVLAADACNEFGLRLAHLSDASLKKLKEIVPSWAEVKNPVDVGRVVDPEIIGRAYPMVLEAFLDDPNVDAILVMAMTVSTQPEFSAFDVLREFAESDLRKPIVVTGLRDAEGLKELATLEMKGIVAFSTVRRAVKALAVAYSRHRFLNQ